MSQSITIPVIGADPLIVVIDGQNAQEFKAGATYTVSDEVAAVIENIIASFPQESGKNAPLVPSPSVADAGKVVSVGSDGQYKLGDDAGSDLPVPTIGDAGKAVVVGDDGKYELGETGGSDNLIIQFDDDTGVCDTTWQEIFDALAAGRNVIYVYIEEGVGVNTTPIGDAVNEASSYNIYSYQDKEHPMATTDASDGYPVAND